MTKRSVALLSLILSMGFAGTLAADASRHVPTIDELLTIKSVGGAQIAPDGKWVAYTVGYGDFKQDAFVTQIWLAEVGTGMLEDGIFVRGDWITDAKNQDVARRFLKATFKGWVFCRDHFAECLQIVLTHDPTLGTGHQRWQLNAVNALIWPAPLGIGVMDPAQFTKTVDISLEFGVIKNPPAGDVVRVDLAQAAVATLKEEGVDVNGANYQKLTVAVTPGGK